MTLSHLDRVGNSMMALRIGYIVLSLVMLTCAKAASPSLPPGVKFIAGKFVAGAQPDGNTVVLNAPDGLIVIDTGRHPEHLRNVFEHAKARKQPIVAVINTHWHLDHIGGNGALRAQFPRVQIYASDALPGALDGFLANYKRDLEHHLPAEKDPAQAAAYRAELGLLSSPQALAPSKVIRSSGEYSIAKMPLQLHIEHAVTAGDLWIHDRSRRLVIAGDLITLPAPLFDTACPQQWSDALRSLTSVEFDVLIPGHGEPLTKQQARAYQRSFDALLACAASERPEGVCIEGWLSDANELITGDAQPLAKSLLSYYVPKHLRDPEKAKTYCAK